MIALWDLPIDNPSLIHQQICVIFSLIHCFSDPHTIANPSWRPFSSLACIDMYGQHFFEFFGNWTSHGDLHICRPNVNQLLNSSTFSIQFAEILKFFFTCSTIKSVLCPNVGNILHDAIISPIKTRHLSILGSITWVILCMLEAPKVVGNHYNYIYNAYTHAPPITK